MTAQPIETTGDSRFQVEASVSGDFHEPATFGSFESFGPFETFESLEASRT